MLKKLVKRICLHTGRGGPFLLLTSPNTTEWAAFLRRQGHRIGEGTTVNPGAQLMDVGWVTIGKRCSVSYASFVTHSGGDRIILAAYGVAVRSQRAIVVGDDCVIGCNATIMYGVTIGNRCVIGAGSVVSRDVPAGTVVRPPEAQRSGSTDEYVARLVARSLS
jgi:acetyltransferase-like isoleucine patch superfamily enzyme